MKLLTMDDFTTVRKAMYDARDKWEEIGEELGLTRSDLRHLTGNNYTKLGEVVEKWLQRRQLNPTWKTLAAVLREKTVDRPDLADDIERDYLGGIRQVRH